MEKLGVLDLGSGFLKVVIADVEDTQPTIVAAQNYRSKGIRRGVIVKNSLARKIVKEALQHTESLTGEKLGGYYILLSHPGIKSQNVKVSLKIAEEPIEVNERHLEELKNEVRKLVEESGYKVIHIVPKYFLLDGEKYFEPLGLWASKIEGEYHIIKIPTQAVKNVEKLLITVGYKPLGVLFPPLMAAELFVPDEDTETNALLVDLGYTTTGFLLLKEDKPTQSGVINMGIRNIAEHIAQRFNLPIKEAEKLVEEVGLQNLFNEEGELTSISVKLREGKEVTISLEEFTHSLTEQIGILLEKVLVELLNRGVNLDRDIERFIFVGGLAGLDGLKLVLESILEKEVQIGIPTNVDAMVTNIDAPFYSPAVGAILFLDRYKEQDENLEALFGLPKNIDNEFPPEVSPAVEEVQEKEAKGFFGKLIASIKRIFSED